MIWGYVKGFQTDAKKKLIKNKINKLGFIKIKNFCFAEGTIQGMKTQTTVWEKVFAITILTKSLYPEYTKNCQNLTVRKQMWTQRLSYRVK